MGSSAGPRPRYRVHQFLQAAAAWLTPPNAAELAAARCCLPAAAWEMFRALPRSDQHHGLQVLRALAAAGHQQVALCQAALLHDCAKHAGGLRLWHWVAVVLLAAVRPACLTGLTGAAEPSASDWRRPFWVHANHAQQGAELAAAAGCDPCAVELIRRHQDRPALTGDPSFDKLLAALQAADDDN